jgi:hypothetical protein
MQDDFFKLNKDNYLVKTCLICEKDEKMHIHDIWCKKCRKSSKAQQPKTYRLNYNK